MCVLIHTDNLPLDKQKHITHFSALFSPSEYPEITPELHMEIVISPFLCLSGPSLVKQLHPDGHSGYFQSA